MIILLTDVFLLLTQVLLWIVVGLITWYVLLKALPRAFLSLLVLLLILAILVLAFVGGTPADRGVLEVLWRIISFPLSPFGLGIVLVWILLSGRKVTTFVKRLILTGLALLVVASTPAASYYLAQELEMEGIDYVRAQPALEGGSRQVIALLGQNTTRLQLRPRTGGPPTTANTADRVVREDAYQIISNLPTQLTEKGDRIIYAAQLYREGVQQGRNPLIIVSAGPRFNRLQKEGEKIEEIGEAQDIQTYLSQVLNVPTSDILLETSGGEVHSQAERIQKLITDQRINNGNQLTLVTSGINMNRAVLTFQKVFKNTEIVARPTDFYTIPSSSSLAGLVQGRDLIEYQLQVPDVLPTLDSFFISSQVLEEYMASLYYFLRGWIKFTPSRIEPVVPVDQRPIVSPTPTPSV